MLFCARISHSPLQEPVRKGSPGLPSPSCFALNVPISINTISTHLTAQARSRRAISETPLPQPASLFTIASHPHQGHGSPGLPATSPWSPRSQHCPFQHSLQNDLLETHTLLSCPQQHSEQHLLPSPAQSRSATSPLPLLQLPHPLMPDPPLCLCAPLAPPTASFCSLEPTAHSPTSGLLSLTIPSAGTFFPSVFTPLALRPQLQRPDGQISRNHLLNLYSASSASLLET